MLLYTHSHSNGAGEFNQEIAMQDYSVYTYSDPDEMTDLIAQEEENQVVSEFMDIYSFSSNDDF